MQEIVVPAQATAKKIENLLKKEFPIGYIRKLFRKNGVRVNGRRARPDDPINPGDRIQLFVPFEIKKPTPTPATVRLDLEIIYENDALLLINKPAGIAVHEGKTVRKRNSVAGLIESKYRDQKNRPRLVHRLDKDTSGLLLLAKNGEVLAELEKQFATGKTDKEYLCLVVGRLPNEEGKIDASLPGRDSSPVRALTRYRVVKRFPETTLVSVQIETGRLHQIRLHFAKLGYPVVMDDQHGDFDFNKRFRKTYGLKRQFLHAAKLAINYQGKRYGWTVPPAHDLQRTLNRLEAK